MPIRETFLNTDVYRYFTLPSFEMTFTQKCHKMSQKRRGNMKAKRTESPNMDFLRSGGFIPLETKMMVDVRKR